MTLYDNTSILFIYKSVLANTMYFNIKNLISLILYIYNNLAANILVALIEKIIMMENTMRITGSGMSN